MSDICLIFYVNLIVWYVGFSAIHFTFLWTIAFLYICFNYLIPLPVIFVNKEILCNRLSYVVRLVCDALMHCVALALLCSRASFSTARVRHSNERRWRRCVRVAIATTHSSGRAFYIVARLRTSSQSLLHSLSARNSASFSYSAFAFMHLCAFAALRHCTSAFVGTLLFSALLFVMRCSYFYCYFFCAAFLSVFHLSMILTSPIYLLRGLVQDRMINLLSTNTKFLWV